MSETYLLLNGGRGEWWGREIKKEQTAYKWKSLTLYKRANKGKQSARRRVSQNWQRKRVRRRVSQNWQRGKYNFWSGQVSHYWRSWWIHFSLNTHALSSTPNESDTQECQYQRRESKHDPLPGLYQKYPRKVPNAIYKSNIRSQRCLLKKVWVLFFFFCFVSISFAFYFLFDMLRREHLSFIVYLLLYLSFIVSFVFSIIGW